MMKEKSRGITLVELQIALALVSLVLALGYSFYFFGTRAFTRGDKQSQVQFDMRMASSFITREVRTATKLDVIPTPTPTTFLPNYHYIFVKDNQIIHRYNDVETAKTAAIIAAVPPEMFSLRQITTAEGQKKTLLAFSFTGTITDITGTQQQKIETEVLLKNLGSKQLASNQAIRYQKP